MTTEEAATVRRIAQTADEGCSVCVGNLLDLLDKSFPEHDWTIPEDEEY